MAILWPFLAIFCQLLRQLSQNWGSDGHFEVLNRCKSWLVQKLWPQLQPEAACKFGELQKKRQLINSNFKPIYGHFFANYMFIFHKTEIQTVILRYLTIINLNPYKSYDTKYKNAKNTKNANACFCTKLQKKMKWKYLRFVS